MTFPRIPRGGRGGGRGRGPGSGSSGDGTKPPDNVRGIEEARAARARHSPQDIVRMFGDESEGTLSAFELGDLINVTKNDKGLVGATTVVLFDPEQFRSMRSRGLRRDEVWDQEALDDFAGRARYITEGADIKLENVPAFDAQIDQLTGTIQVFTHDWYDEAIETAVSLLEHTGSSARKMPFQLMWNEELIKTLRHVRQLNGRVEFLDAQTREVIGVTSLRELNPPFGWELMGYIDPVMEQADLLSQGRVLRFEGDTGNRILKNAGGEMETANVGPRHREVREVEVKEDMRGQGYGTQLYEAAVEDALAEGRLLVSDERVSLDAARRWVALSREHPIQMNAASVEGRTLISDGPNPVFEMLPPGTEIKPIRELPAAEAGPAARGARQVDEVPDEFVGAAGRLDDLPALKQGEIRVREDPFEPGGLLIEALNGEISAMRRGDTILQITGSEVARSAQGQGLGTELYERAFKVAKADGRRLVSDTVVSDLAAQRWMAMSFKYPVKMNDATRSNVSEGWVSTTGRPVFEILEMEELSPALRRQALGPTQELPHRIEGDAESTRALAEMETMWTTKQAE